MYCDRRQRQKAGLCCNTTQPAQDTAQALGVGRAVGSALERCDTAACALRYGHAGGDTTEQLGHNTAVAPTTRPGMRAPVRACVPSWASFGACAPSLVFDLLFRLSIGSESPFGPGS